MADRQDGSAAPSRELWLRVKARRASDDLGIPIEEVRQGTMYDLDTDTTVICVPMTERISLAPRAESECR